MRATIRKHYPFGVHAARVGEDLIRPEAWDTLRELPGPFRLPVSREEWERSVLGDETRARAADIARIATQLGARRVASYGVGTAGVELALVQLKPTVQLTCTDYAPRAVERLATLFPEARVVPHDLRLDAPLDADLHVLHRVDDELGAAEWMRVLPRFREPIVLVPVALLNARTALGELARRVGGRKLTWSGYLRSEAALRHLWRDYFSDQRIVVGTQRSFLLTPRSARDS